MPSKTCSMNLGQTCNGRHLRYGMIGTPLLYIIQPDRFFDDIRHDEVVVLIKDLCFVPVRHASVNLSTKKVLLWFALYTRTCFKQGPFCNMFV